jgi:outer membrane protein OmpA-like peptidoglycan-associated protein
VTPFVLLGAGALGVSSDRAVVGIEVDPALHFGGGVKFFLNRWVSLRLDLRDVVSNRHGDSESFGAHDFEALLGLSVTLVRKREERKPPPPADGDGDGFIDAKDACPKEAGTEADGCPIRDEDGDGLVDAEDACPKEAGTETDGCPIRDTDNDGIMDPDDQCKDEPETKNRVDDQDGCPDEIPEEVKKFSGTIDGIAFENGKDTIKPESEAALAAALEILQKYPDLRLKVTGHTDDKGKPEDNLDLSRRRADAVVRWFTDHGLAADRLEAEGHGAEKPIADNKTKAGRTKNRRIEFELLQ